MQAWFLWLCAVLLTSAGCLSGPANSASSVQTEFADVALTDEALAKALSHFAQGRLLEEADGRASPAALHHYQQGLEADPGNHELASRVAVVALHRQDPDTAVDALETSWRRAPHDVKRTVDLAAVYQASGRLDEAVSFYTKALDRDPSTTTVYMAIADIHFREDREQAAVSILEDGLSAAAEPEFLIRYLEEQGKRFVAHGVLDKAILCFELLADREELHSATVYTLLAELYLAEQRISAAEQAGRKAIRLPDPPPEAFIQLAAILMESRPGEARQLLKKVETQASTTPALLFALGSLYSDLGDHSQAIPFLEKFRRHFEEDTPDSRPATALSEVFFLYLGAAYEQTGETGKAQAVFKECLQQYPDSHIIMNYLAYMLAEAEMHLEQALQYSIRALTFAPDSAAYLDTLGWIYFKMGRLQLALDTITAANNMMGDDAEILLHLGDVHHALGNTEKALDFWNRSFIIDTSGENRASRQLLRYSPPDSPPASRGNPGTGGGATSPIP